MNLFEQRLLIITILICFLLVGCANKKPNVIEITKITAEKTSANAVERQGNERATADATRIEAAKQAAGIANAQAEAKKVMPAIRQKVNSRWIRPPESANLQCTIQVRLISDGSVIDVKIVKSSGNEEFDSSVDAAIKNASPLPVTADKELFEREFKTFRIMFNSK